MSSLTTQLKAIDMTNKESFKSLVKMIDQFDSKVDEKVKVKVDSLKSVVVSEVTDTIKDNVSDQIRREVRELDQQKLRSLNLMCFNMVESKSTNSKERQRSDEEQFRNLCGAIGIDTVDIKSMFRIGIPKSGSNRPLKIVLNNKRERKQILDKVRLIKSVDDESLKKCVITKDFTPRQREENKAKRDERKKESVPKSHNESNVYDEETVLEEMSGPSQNILQVHNHIMPQCNDSSSASRLISDLELQESGLNDTVIAGVLTDNYVSVPVEIRTEKQLP